MVPRVGLEPTLLSELDFESSASTNSTTGACYEALGARGVISEAYVLNQSLILQVSYICTDKTAKRLGNALFFVLSNPNISQTMQLCLKKNAQPREKVD